MTFSLQQREADGAEGKGGAGRHERGANDKRCTVEGEGDPFSPLFSLPPPASVHRCPRVASHPPVKMSNGGWHVLATSSRSTVEECYLRGNRRITRKTVNNVGVMEGLPYRLLIYQHYLAKQQMKAHYNGFVCVSDVQYARSREVTYQMVGIGSQDKKACTLFELLNTRTSKSVSMKTRINLMNQLCMVISRFQHNMCVCVL